MLLTYLKIAWRNLGKNRVNTAINIVGLAIGMASCLLIALFVADELSFDRHWLNGERVYRMALERRYPDRVSKYAMIPQSYAEAVRREIPGVQEAVRVFNFNGGNATTLLKIGSEVHEEQAFLAVDSTFFRVFQTALLRGTPDAVLSRPNTLVLTESTAKRLFGTQNPLGKTIELVQGPKLEVTGVCADFPRNTHFSADFLASTKGFPFADQTNFINFSAHTYLLLRPGVSPETVQAKLPALVEKYAAGPVQRNFGVTYREYLKAGNGYFYFLQPLLGIHLDSNLEAELRPNGNRTLVYVFSVIAAFILLIACINFMNLATARSGERAREVGIRKTLGSTRGQLAAQFLTESVIQTLAGFALAMGLVTALLPAFNSVSGKELSATFFLNAAVFPLLLGLALMVGLLAGAYPAGVLARFEPIRVLRGRFASTRQGQLLRNGLVVFQFTVSILLIISTMVVLRQLSFIQSKELGFTKEHVLTLQGVGFLGPKTEAFKREVERMAGVVSVGSTSATPGTPNFFGMTIRKPGQNETLTGRGVVVDDRFLQTLGVTMAQGRAFSREFNDSLSVILNEEAVQRLGLIDPIGKTVLSPDRFGRPGTDEVNYTVVGVVKNFHFTSLHDRIAPLFVINDRWFNRLNNQMVVRIQAENPAAILAQTERLWKSYLPDQPFRYSFLDEDWTALYRTEQVSQQIFGVFALLAIFIACMGLLGLAMYVIQQRTKEIGIRKVLGASVPGLVALLSKDFLKLVVLAILLASPLAWWAMDHWLQDFAYRIAMPWWAFGLAGIMAVLIALLTVSFQSVKAALMDPVKSLRSE
jgi:putative ABC transport system permease protein